MITFTEHAIARYIQRHVRGCDRAEAEQRLLLAAPQAVRLKERSVNGQILWRSDELGITLVTKPEGGDYVCVTVLPRDAKDTKNEEAYSEMMRILEEKPYLLAASSKEI